MKKSFFIGANWKMNPIPTGALHERSPYCSIEAVQVVVFPMIVDIRECISSAMLSVGAQCGRPEESGAFTGDSSIKHLAEIGCKYLLCGHSERRKEHHETNEIIAKQVHTALVHGITPVLCIGENEEEQKAGKTYDALRLQLKNVVDVCSSLSNFSSLIVAYEPVWAIGKGKTPTPAEVDATHQFIRSLLPDASMRIIYGGSVTATNCPQFFSLPNVDGALVGGASLQPDEFGKIVQCACDLVS